ncbi:MAG TPA: DUF2807 domain-containing protein [Allosphingosinicella sp.]
MRIPAALLLFSAAFPADAAVRQYPVPDFTRIEVAGPFRVAVTVGGPSGISARGDIALLDRLRIDTIGQTLRIRFGPSAGESGAGGPVEITVATRTLAAASLAGSGNLRIANVKGGAFSLTLGGSGSAAAEGLAVDRLNVAVRGSGAVRLSGTAKTTDAAIQGTASLDGEALTAGDARIASESAGAVRLTARRSASIAALGTGDVTVLGKPACTIDARGGGAVSCGSR